MSQPEKLPAKIEAPRVAVKPTRVTKRATRIERPPDKQVEVVHIFQWHLIIRALWPYAVLLAVVFGVLNIPMVEIAKIIVTAR